MCKHFTSGKRKKYESSEYRVQIILWEHMSTQVYGLNISELCTLFTALSFPLSLRFYKGSASLSIHSSLFAAFCS